MSRQLFWGILFVVALIVMAFVSLIGGFVLAIIFLVLEYREIRLARRPKLAPVPPPPPTYSTATATPVSPIPAGASGEPIPAAPYSPPPPAAPTAVPVPFCVNCGRATTYIPQYGRYYCYACNRYA